MSNKNFDMCQLKISSKTFEKSWSKKCSFCKTFEKSWGKNVVFADIFTFYLLKIGK